MKQPIGLNRVNQWVNQQSLKALNQAYLAALAIKAIEDQHFNGQKIAPNSEQGKSVYDYFQSILERELLKIRLNLTQFRLSNFLNPIKQVRENEGEQKTANNQETEILQTLSLIESVIGKYRTNPEDLEFSPVISAPAIANLQAAETPNQESLPAISESLDSARLPIRGRSFFNFRRELTPEYEQQVVQQLRLLRSQKRTAIRFLILLIIIPFFVHILSKNIIYTPLFNRIFVDQVKVEKIEISEEIAEHYLEEFTRLKEVQEVKSLLGIIPEISEEKKHELLKEKAKEMAKEAAYKTLDGLKNFAADLTSLAAFAIIVYFGRREFTILRQFVSRYFLDLSDVTKVFIFILLTDMFVGFHSAHGWEIALEKLFGHFGLPENRDLIFLFIATVPVILDSAFKLLIFNYFTRQSPSSVAILEKMQK